MIRSDLIRQVAQHLEPWAWETRSFNATMARDDAMFKAEQIVDLFGPAVAPGDRTSTAEARIRAVTAEMRRYLPNACGDWADEIDHALAMYPAALSTPATLDNTAVEGQEAISDATHEALWAADAENERLRAALTRIEQFVRDFRTPWGSWKTAWWEGEVSDDAALTEDNALMHIANVASATLTAKTEKAE